MAKKPQKKYLIYILAVLFLNSSCAHFQNSITRSIQKKITDETILDFSREFEINPNKIFVGKTGEAFENPKEINLFKLLSGSNLNFKADYVKPEFSPDKISFLFYENKTLVKKIEIEAKLKRNGFIKLKNTRTNCQGIPYLFGGCDQKKMRIGFTNEGQMIVQEAVSNTGAFLFIFGTGYSFNAVYIFNKKKQD